MTIHSVKIFNSQFGLNLSILTHPQYCHDTLNIRNSNDRYGFIAIVGKIR